MFSQAYQRLCLLQQNVCPFSLSWCSAFPCGGDCPAPACHTQCGTKLVAAPHPVTPISSWLYLSQFSLISMSSAVVLHIGHPHVWQPLLDQAHGTATMAHLLQLSSRLSIWGWSQRFLMLMEGACDKCIGSWKAEWGTGKVSPGKELRSREGNCCTAGSERKTLSKWQK